ncbi:hypothetical protein P7C70_g7201, partial [Phenoliferia sp. Uapishka_3]
MSHTLATPVAKPNGETQFIESARSPDQKFDFTTVDENLITIEGEDKVRLQRFNVHPLARHSLTLGNSKINGYTTYLSCIASISGFLFGWDTAVIGGALGNIGTGLGGRLLTATEQEWAVASLSAGAMIGALVGGTYSDTIGRKPVLIIGDGCFVIGAVLLCSSYGLAQFIVGRIVMGFGVGIAAVVCAVYIGELAPYKVRGKLVAIQSVAITGGQCIANGVSAGLDKTHNGWRILFAISLPFAIGQAVAMHFLPESPRFDVVIGRQDRARNTLERIYPSANEREIDLKLKAIQLTADLSNSLKKQHPSIKKRLGIILSTGRYRRCVSVAAGLFIVQQLCGFNTLLYYSSVLFGAVGFSNPSAVGILVSGVNALMSVVSMFTMDRVGRRRIFLIGVPIMTIALAIAAVAFSEMTKPTGGRLITTQADQYNKSWVGLMLGMMVLFIIGYAPSLGTLAYTSIELIPLEIRGMGSAIAISFQWGSNVLLSATFLTLMNHAGPAGAYAVYCSICFIGFVFIFFCYPEPSGLSLEETATLFVDGYGVKKAGELRRAHAQIRSGEGSIGDDFNPSEK